MGSSSSKDAVASHPTLLIQKKYAVPASIRRATVATASAVQQIKQVHVAHRPSKSTRLRVEENAKDIELLFEVDALDLKVHKNLSGGLVRDIQTEAVWATIPRAVNGRPSKALLVDRSQRILTKRENSSVFQELKHHVHLSTFFYERTHADSSFSTQTHYLPRVQELQHPHILRLFAFYMHNRKLHILIEYCQLGNLASVLDIDERFERTHKRRLPIFHGEQALKESIRQLCSGVVFLHDAQLVHTNLSTENVFVSDNGHIVVGDFKEAVFFGPCSDPVALPPPIRHGFAAPERYSDGDESELKVDMIKADAWSVGVLIFMMITRQQLFSAASSSDLNFQQFRQLGFVKYYDVWRTRGRQRNIASVQVPEDVISLLSEVLVVHPSKRCRLKELTERYEWLRPGGLLAELDTTHWKT